MPITINISMGEAFDRLSILRIKVMKISEHKEAEKHKLCVWHFENMKEPLDPILNNGKDMTPLALFGELFTINLDLWEVEDKLRHMEGAMEFGKRFVDLARSVYILNDKRSAKKQEIDRHFGETVGEVKSYVALEKS